MMNGWNMTGWGWGWMSLWTLVVIVVIALLVTAFIRSSRPPDTRTSEDPALTVLRRRYAAGEIDEAEFETRRTALES